MRVETHDGEPERSILIALIVCTPFLAKVSKVWDKSLFRSEWSDIIAGWCVDHFKKYNQAPGKKIVTIFHAWSEKAQNEDLRKLINRLLAGLSKQYEALAKDIDVKHISDVAEAYFRTVKTEKHVEELKLDLERGHGHKAFENAQRFKGITLSVPEFVDLLKDKEVQRQALENKQKVVIRYTGDAGKFFGDELSEESLVALVAPMKIGKSYYMEDMAWQGLKQGNNVAFFQIGDLSRNQIVRRFHARAAYRPLKRRVVRYPISITPAQHGLCQVDYEARPYDSDLTWKQGEKAFEKQLAKFGEDKFRLSWHPTMSISIEGIRNILMSWADTGWLPKVVAIDYSENLAPINPKESPLNQVEMTWAMMSRIREEFRCCLITALQSPKEAFNAWVHTRRHFSKNKMIFAHATSIIGLNRTDEEAQRRVMRLNFVVRREELFSETKCCYLAECRDLSHVTVLSSFHAEEDM